MTKPIDPKLAKFIADSKVKERLYHGTSNDITQFDTNRGKGLMLGAGTYFTPNVKKAESYAGDIKGQGATIMPVHVSLKNPIETSIFDKKYMGSVSDVQNARLRAKGHDGIILKNPDGSVAEVVAFHPHQIKSAIGNRGTYDPNDPDITKAKGGKVEVRPTVFDDAASRRNPSIEAAALAVMKGELKQKAYAKLVAKEKPVKAYDFIPKPATDEQAMDVLLDRQKQNWKSHNNWPAGRRVGLRLDIPAYERYGVWVNSVHDEEGSGEHKLPNSYGPVSSVRNATFEGSPDKAVRVATGEQRKNSFARIKGNLEHIDEEDAIKHFQKYMNHPDYRQVGYDPRRHGDFYDRETMQPITHSEHVVQIGPLVLAKNPKYGKPTLYAKGGVARMAVGGPAWSPHPENELLQPIGSSKMVGDEKLVSDDGEFKSGLSMFPSSRKSYRYVYHDEDQTPVGAMQIATQGPRSKKAVIQNLYVAEANRRQGIASKLLDRARKDFDVKHSDDLTTAGKAFAKAKKAHGGQVLYHGTPYTDKTIKKFKITGGGDFGPGIYMTTSPKSASTFSQGVQGNKSGAVYPLHATIKNPLTVKDKYHMNAIFDNNKSGKPVHEHLQSLGYDGIHVTNPNENDPSEQYFVAFHPKQVKSSITGKAHGGSVTHAHHLEIEERPL